MLEIMKTREGLTGFKKGSRNFRINHCVENVASTKIIF